MTSGIASLYKILKDDNRQKIIVLINENGSLSYTDLIKKLDTVSTGLLNYHLKILGDLLSKNEEGQYTLSEKGRLASKLLEEFPEQENLSAKRKRQKRLWLALGLSQAVFFIVVLALYSQRYVDSAILIMSTVTFVGMIAITYLGYRLRDNPLTPELRAKKKFTGVYIAGGGTAGAVVVFFGTPIASFISVSAGGPNLLRVIGFDAVYFLSYLSSAVVVGCLIGYYIGRRQSFRQPKWGKWLEEHTF
jgi:F0F1-type ATP synthase assembly protein I